MMRKNLGEMRKPMLTKKVQKRLARERRNIWFRHFGRNLESIAGSKVPNVKTQKHQLRFV